jgi:hypothetical protein
MLGPASITRSTQTVSVHAQAHLLLGGRVATLEHLGARLAQGNLEIAGRNRRPPRW